MLVRENISFERGKDPRKILNIGIHYPRTFKTKKELIDYLMIAMLDIFDGEIPEDILNRPGGGELAWPYFWMISDFLEKYNMTYIDNYGKLRNDWRIADSTEFGYWPTVLKEKLIELGYEKRN